MTKSTCLSHMTELCFRTLECALIGERHRNSSRCRLPQAPMAAAPTPPPTAEPIDAVLVWAIVVTSLFLLVLTAVLTHFSRSHLLNSYT